MRNHRWSETPKSSSLVSLKKTPHVVRYETFCLGYTISEKQITNAVDNNIIRATSESQQWWRHKQCAVLQRQLSEESS